MTRHWQEPTWRTELLRKVLPEAQHLAHRHPLILLVGYLPHPKQTTFVQLVEKPLPEMELRLPTPTPPLKG